jgi:hypothetical protein
MRHVKLTLALLLTLIASSAQSADTADTWWTILQGEENGRKIVVSVINRLPDLEIRARSPTLLKVQWGYQDNESGMPSEEEIALMHSLEDGLYRIVTGQGIHAMNRTGNGGRTWFFYVGNVEALRIPIKDFFDAQEPMSIKVSAEQDAEWSRISEVLQDARILVK